MPLVDLATIPQVTLAFMNDDHRVEATLLNEAVEALSALREGTGSRTAMLKAYEGLVVHTAEHFAREEEAMRRTGFFAYAMHSAEHDRVLAELRAMGEAFEAKGDVEGLWTYLTSAVPSWFVAHIESMDRVTAGFVAMRGG